MASGTSDSIGADRPDGAIGGPLRTDDLLDALAEACYPVFRWLFDEDSDFVASIDERLSQALLDVNVELFLSRAVAIGLLLGGTLWLSGLVVGYVVFGILVPDVSTIAILSVPGVNLPASVLSTYQALEIPLLIGLSGVLFGTVGFALGFGTPILTLYNTVYNRAREIDMLLPDTIAYMYALSVGGMNHIEILESVAEAEDVYGEVAREFQTIVQKTRYFDTDYRTAIHDRSAETPCEPLSQFFTDMLSIVNSGGDMTAFFDDKADRHLEIARRRQEETLDTLELMGEMYLAISLFPLLLIILLVVMAMVGQQSTLLLYLSVYGLIPAIGLTFLVMISIIKRDELSEGYLTPPGDRGLEEARSRGNNPTEGALLGRPIASAYTQVHDIFEQIDRRERSYRVQYVLTNLHELFVRKPMATLVVTGPLAVVAPVFLFVSGIGPQSLEELMRTPMFGTVLYLYLPLFLTLAPLAVFHEWYDRYRYGVLDDLSETLRKLSSANDTGMTLLESFRTVAETSKGRLAEEFDDIYTKVTYRMSLKGALIEFNNRYHIPRLARVMKLITEAQETSSHITAVLTTAARASENQDRIARDRKTRTRMQIAIIIMTYLTLLGVMAILKIQFLEVIAEIAATADTSGGTAGGIALGTSLDVDRLSMLFFHAVTLQAIVSGLIAGYLRDSTLMSGVKFVVALLVVTLLVWIPVA